MSNYFANQQMFTNKPSLLGRLAQRIASNHFTTKSMVVTGAEYGHQVLDQILQRLDSMLTERGTEEQVKEGMAMRYAVAHAIELAYTDWAEFCRLWEVEIYYHGDHWNTGIYVFYFKELSNYQLQYHFKFTGV